MKINAKGQSSSFCCFPSSSSFSCSFFCSSYSVWLINDSCSTGREVQQKRQRDRLRQRRERSQVLLSRGYLWVQGSSCLYSSSSFSFSLAGRLLWLLLFNIEPDAESDRPPLYVLLLFFCTLQHTQHKVVACHNDRVLVLDSCFSCFSPSHSLCLSLLFCFAFQCAIICFCPGQDNSLPGTALETFCVHSYLNLSCGFLIVNHLLCLLSPKKGY